MFNSSGYLYLFAPHPDGSQVEMDSVTWTSSDFSEKNYAYQIDDPTLENGSSDAVWCTASSSFGSYTSGSSTKTLYGTPGAANTPCP